MPWAASEEARLSLEQRQPEKIVAGIQSLLSSSYLAFTVRMDSASTEQARQFLSTRQQTAKFEQWGEQVAGFYDMDRTTLRLMGRAGARTAPHVDWADAETFAIAVGQNVFLLRARMSVAMRSL